MSTFLYLLSLSFMMYSKRNKGKLINIRDALVFDDKSNLRDETNYNFNILKIIMIKKKEKFDTSLHKIRCLLWIIDEYKSVIKTCQAKISNLPNEVCRVRNIKTKGQTIKSQWIDSYGADGYTSEILRSS